MTSLNSRGRINSPTLSRNERNSRSDNGGRRILGLGGRWTSSCGKLTSFWSLIDRAGRVDCKKQKQIVSLLAE
jgi:hypothetical protein